MIKTLDLFAGAGGLSLGLEEAGVKVVGAIEIDRFACETYRYNFPKTKLYETDITKIKDKDIKKMFSGVDVVLGGPPCQGFSVAGPSQYGKIDERNKLILEFINFVNNLQPKLAVFENVKGILAGKMDLNIRALDAINSAFNKIGYVTKVHIIQAADFGVPQWRERAFVFASKNEKLIPQNISRKYGSNEKPWRTVWDAISDLPQIDSGQGIEEKVEYNQKPNNSFQIWCRKKSKGIYNHVSMKHTQRLIERFKYIPIGKSLVHVPIEHGQRVRNGDGIDIKKRFKMNNQRLNPQKVSLAITASFQSNFVHPYLNRNLTAREGARLQSFPDRFVFNGPRTLMSKNLLVRENRMDEIGLSQYNQIGNAVPPLLAKEIGLTIKRMINHG